jgi:hypothetical protein
MSLGLLSTHDIYSWIKNLGKIDENKDEKKGVSSPSIQTKIGDFKKMH